MQRPIVEKNVIVPVLDDPIRLDRYLAGIPELDLSRAFIQAMISEGRVRVNGRSVAKNLRLRGGEAINLTIIPPALADLEPENIPLDIRYEDDHLAIINKPAGLVVHPAPGNPDHTLVNAILYHFGTVSTGDELRPGVIHRLDKNTSGLIIIAKNDGTARKMRELFAERKIKKTYQAFVCGALPDQSGTIDLPIGRSIRDRKKMVVTNVKSREAVTHYRILTHYRLLDFVEIHLETGRTHQIRVHLTHINRPVFGDPEYGGRIKWLRGIDPMLRRAGQELLDLIDRQALHASSIEFVHPIGGNVVSVSVELPEDMRRLQQILEDRFKG